MCVAVWVLASGCTTFQTFHVGCLGFKTGAKWAHGQEPGVVCGPNGGGGSVCTISGVVLWIKRPWYDDGLGFQGVALGWASGRVVVL